MVGIEAHSEGVVIPVRVSPGASRDRIMGEHDGALKMSVSAAPEKGKANKAVCALIAKALGIAKSRVSLMAGETARDKKILVRNMSRSAIARQLIPSPSQGEG